MRLGLGDPGDFVALGLIEGELGLTQTFLGATDGALSGGFVVHIGLGQSARCPLKLAILPINGAVAVLSVPQRIGCRRHCALGPKFRGSQTGALRLKRDLGLLNTCLSRSQRIGSGASQKQREVGLCRGKLRLGAGEVGGGDIAGARLRE